MKFIKMVLLGVCFGTSVLANAGTMNCSSVGEMLPENRLVIDATVETSWWGNVLKAGTFSYRASDTATESTAGSFTCEQPNEKKIVFCSTLTPDANVQRIVAHPVMGLMFQLSGQPHAAMFNCKNP